MWPWTKSNSARTKFQEALRLCSEGEVLAANDCLSSARQLDAQYVETELEDETRDDGTRIVLKAFATRNLELLSEAIRRFPDCAVAYINRGLVRQWVLHDSDGAQSDYCKALKLSPSHSKADMIRGFTVALERKRRLATLQAQDLSSDTPAALYRAIASGTLCEELAKAALDPKLESRYAELLKVYYQVHSAILGKAPEDSNALRRMYHVATVINGRPASPENLDRAAGYYRMQLDQDESNGQACVSLWRIERIKNGVSYADTRWLQLAARANEGSADAHVLLADIALERDARAEAEREIAIALETDPENADGLMAKCQLLWLAGNRTEAESVLIRCHRADPEHIHAQIAVLSRLAGQVLASMR